MRDKCITPGSVRLSAPVLTCRFCGAIDEPVLTEGTGPHFAGARCRHCHKFLQWLSRYTPAERAQRRQAARSPSQPQLDFLVDLNDPNPPPITLVEATARIAALLQAHRGQR